MRMLSAPRNKMALMTRLKKAPEDNANDITKNLFSLQFESALNEEEKELLHLRARSHAISVYHCTQATYFVEILREIRFVYIFECCVRTRHLQVCVCVCVCVHE